MKRTNILTVVLIILFSFTLLLGDNTSTDKYANIFNAIYARDVAAINDMIDTDPNVLNSKVDSMDSRFREWVTPLNYALRWSSPDMAQAILDHNPPVDVRDSKGLLPVHILVQMHTEKMLEQLVALGADIHSTDTIENGDALYWAAFGGKNDMIRYLLDKGLDINQLKPNGRTPLNKAAQGGRIYAFELLLERGANLPTTNSAKELLFQDAVAGGNLRIVKYLINLGYNPRQITSEGEISIFSALWSKSTDLMSYLIDQGADVNQLNEGGSSLLWVAIDLHKKDFVRLLIDKGANLNLAVKDGLTPFFLAVRECPDVLQNMLDKGVDINRKDKYGDTALLVSVNNDSLIALQTLLRYKADLNIQNKNGQTALILACQIQNEEIAGLLIKAGSALEIRDVNGRSAMHIAVLNGNPVLVKALIDAGADLNAKDKDGFTALDYALKYAYKDIARLLKSKHAKTEYKNASQAVGKIDLSHEKNVIGVWYLGDSGIAVRSGQNLLIFDYLKPQVPNINPSLYTNPRERQTPANPSLYNGWINPDEIKGLNVYVFVTNRSMDPLNRGKGILELKDQIPNVKYVFGFDTQPGFQNYMYPRLPRYEPIRGSKTDSNGVSVTSIKFKQEYMHRFEDLIGYCVKVNGITIWYSGCFFNKSDTLSVAFKAGINSLVADNPEIDLAFLPVAVPGRGNYADLKQNSDYFVKKIKPKTIVPVHIASRVIDDSWSSASPEIDNSIWTNATQAMGYGQKTKVFQNPGDHFIFTHSK